MFQLLRMYGSTVACGMITEVREHPKLGAKRAGTAATVKVRFSYNASRKLPGG
jgi:hypothetical protein